MVCDDIHQDLKPLSVSLFDKLPIEFVAAETGIDVIVVGCRITVIGLVLRIIFQKRSRPDCCRTEFRDVVEMVDNPLNVTAVSSEKFAAVRLFSGVGRRIIRRVAICKAVRHNEINHIRARKTFPLRRALNPRPDFVGTFETLLPFCEHEIICPRLRIR